MSTARLQYALEASELYPEDPQPRRVLGELDATLGEDAEGRLLYTQRNHEPAMGAWAWPSGFVDRGEEIRAAAIREVQEETGVDAAIDRLIGAYSRPDDPLVFIAFAGHALGGDLRLGDAAQLT